MKITAFAATSSKNSINKQLVSYAAGLIDNAEVELLDLNDFELPMYSQDLEAESGIPAAAKAFYDKLGQNDAIMISFAEHNGTYTAAYKNLFDWCSRIDRDVFHKKPMVLLATSPGPGGAANVLSTAVSAMPYFGGEVKASQSVPSFFDNFSTDTAEVTNDEIKAQLVEAVAALTK